MLMTTLLGFTLAASTPPAPPAAATSPTEAARYALTHGCLAAARQGVKLATLSNPSIELAEKDRGLYVMKGAGQILMSDSPPQVGCYMRVGQGNGEDLRRMALGLLAAEAPTRVVQDSGPGSKPMRQELHCVKVAGRSMAALISSSSGQGGAPLQFSLLNGQDICRAP